MELFSHKKAMFLLQFGLAFVFLYAAVASLRDPGNWVGFLPPYFDTLIPSPLLLKIFSVFEIVLGLWLLSSWKVFYAGVVASMAFAGILFANFGIFDVTFRDVGLLFAAASLAVSAKSQK